MHMFTPKNLETAEMGGVDAYLEDLSAVRGKKKKSVPRRFENGEEVMSENGEGASEP